MKKEKFSESLNSIDDKYIEEAVNYSAAENAEILEANISDDAKSSSTDSGKGTPAVKTSFTDISKSSSADAKKESMSKDNNTIKYAKSRKIWRAIAIVACSIILVFGLGITLIVSRFTMGSSMSSSSGSPSDYAKDGDYYITPTTYYDEDVYFESPTTYYYDEDIYYESPADYYDEDIYFGSPTDYYDEDIYYESPADYYDKNHEMGVKDGSSNTYIGGAETNVSPMEEEAVLGASGASAGAGQTSTNALTTPEKMIYTVYISMETTDFDNTVSAIDNFVSSANGYYENFESYNNGSSYRDAYYTIRIPAENLDSFLYCIKKSGTITSINRNASDVSDYYYDIESRLETAKTKLARLQELLAQAEDMTDIITIENEISNTEYEIDSLSGALKNYDSKIGYSTVTIDLREVYKVSIDDPAPLTFGERISSAFTNGVTGFGDFLENLAVLFAYGWIWLVIIAAIVVAVVLIVKKSSKKRKDK